jgi:hypothetical protein
VEDHGWRGYPVRLSTEMVELFGFHTDGLLKEATLPVRDRELFAGAPFEMVCAKLCTVSLSFQPCEMASFQTPNKLNLQFFGSTIGMARPFIF